MKDAPDIRMTEATGYPDIEVRWPRCPVCGRECETIYQNGDGYAVGCDECLTALDAWEVMNDD